MTFDSVSTIKFNGDYLFIKRGSNLMDILFQKDLISGRFVVVINDDLVPISEYSNIELYRGDALEIISPITGG